MEHSPGFLALVEDAKGRVRRTDIDEHRKMRIANSLSLILAGLLCVSGAPAVAGEIAGSGSYLKPVIAELQKDWPQNRTVTIVFHGHSVPSGYFKTPEVHSLEAYPHLVREGLARRFPHAVINVVVTARGGENSIQGERRFEQDVLACQPDVVLIDYSLNDRGPGLEAARAAWVKMIRAARDRGAAVILLTPTPDLRARFGDPSDPLQQHAAQVRMLASEFQVGLIDSLKAFEQARTANRMPELMSQTNHPNTEGHRIVADMILKYFEADPAPR